MMNLHSCLPSFKRLEQNFCAFRLPVDMNMKQRAQYSRLGKVTNFLNVSTT